MDGQRILSGDMRDTLVDGATLEVDPQMAGIAALVVHHRDGAFVVPLPDGEPVVVGREEPSQVRPRSRRLSRQHARFLARADRVWVEDLDSTNGTFLNGARIAERVVVGPEDEVSMGSVTITLHGGAAGIATLAGEQRFAEVVAEELSRAATFRRPVAVVAVTSAVGAPRHGWSPPVRDALRAVDRMAIVGTDQLLVMLPEAERSDVRALLAPVVEAHDLHLGLAVGRPDQAPSAAALIEAARQALSDTEDAVAEVPETAWVAQSPAMVRLFQTVERVAPSMLSVLIRGETGAGKEVVARALHERSDRRDGPLRCINCGAIPGNLVESTLFGHERGAFTGADQQRAGVFEEARGGTVLLDEIGELSLAAQVALLRVLETRCVQRVGSSRDIPVDVRVIAATHRDLEEMCADGLFRLDLLYRLNPVTLLVPPLRERTDEIEALVARFVAQANQLNRRAVTGPTAAALDVLRSYPWPGNVRELRNVVERAVVVAGQGTFSVEDLPERVVGRPLLLEHTPSVALRGEERITPGRTVDAVQRGLRALDLKARVQEHEQNLICAALAEANGNQSEAARRLQMPRRTLVYKLKAFDIDPDHARPDPELLRGRRSFRERVEHFEQGLIEEAMARAGGDEAIAAQLLSIQKRTLVAKLARR